MDKFLLEAEIETYFLPYSVYFTLLDEDLDVGATKNKIWTTKS